MSYFFKIAQKRNKFASKRTLQSINQSFILTSYVKELKKLVQNTITFLILDYFQKKYPEYANKRLVSQIERDGERHGSSCRMQYFNNYLTRVIMSQKLLQRVAMML